MGLLFTSSFETKIGGSISDHILFGKDSIELIIQQHYDVKKLAQNIRLKILDAHILEQS